MIEAINLAKNFDSKTALQELNATIQNGSIYGLVGSNGAGKSTFLRLIAGVYEPSVGSIKIDGENIFENTKIKNKVFFVSDDYYFLPYSTTNQMAKYLSAFYENWSWERYEKLCSIFPINPSAKIYTFSKGMKRQSALILALSSMPDYLLLDEAFDGIDPVIRTAIRKLLSDDVANRNLTVLISSHNLRELEDFCDQVGLLHDGKVLFQRDIDDLKLGFCKVQCVFDKNFDDSILKSELEILKIDKRESLYTIIAKGNKDDVLDIINEHNPIFSEAISLTLEEVFIYEMEAVGYDYNNIIF